MLGNQEIDYGYYTNGWKNEFHQESCFEVAVTGLVCLLVKHQLPAHRMLIRRQVLGEDAGAGDIHLHLHISDTQGLEHHSQVFLSLISCLGWTIVGCKVLWQRFYNSPTRADVPSVDCTGEQAGKREPYTTPIHSIQPRQYRTHLWWTLSHLLPKHWWLCKACPFDSIRISCTHVHMFSYVMKHFDS